MSTQPVHHRLVSIVVPFLNEAENLPELVRRIEDSARALPIDYEILLVNDGSTDDSGRIAAALCATNRRLRLINFMRNFGKASALSAGFAHSRGEIVVTMDADLQDDPKELGRFLERIDAGYDVVSGWKQVRHDPIGKTFPSKIFNYLVRKTFKLDLHDINCGYKAYTRAAVEALNLYGELHRFTPALLHGIGFSVTEIAVLHNPRRFGKSKYGAARFVKGLLDLMTVVLLTRYQARPLHFFGAAATILGGSGFLILCYLTGLWLTGLGPIGNRPLFFLGILLVVSAMQLLSVGLIAELIQTARLKESGKYAIRDMVGFKDDPESQAPLPVLPAARQGARHPS